MAPSYTLCYSNAMRFLASFLLVLGLGACDPVLTFLAGEDWQAQGSGAFTQTHWSGSQADATAKTTIVARNQAEWENLWERVAAPAPGPLPRSKMAVAVLVGQRPNSGFRVEIIRAGKEFLFGQVERYVVQYRVHQPETGKAYPQVLASPWAIRLGDYSEGEVDFNEVR